jgi:hypothetical protein
VGITHRTEHTITWSENASGLLECRSHAIRDDDGRVWVIDPVEMSGLVEEVRSFGTPAGVIVLLDRHLRAAPEVAARLGVPLYFPAGNQRQQLPDDVIRYTDRIEGCPFEFPLVRQSGRAWIERALWWPARRVLVVAEAIGTVDFFRARPDEPYGVHPMMRVMPPKRLLGYDPELVLVGHGDPVDAPASAMERVIRRTRRDSVRWGVRLPALMRAVGSAKRDDRMGC